MAESREYRRRWGTEIAQQLGVAAAYALTGHLGQLLVMSSGEHITAVWAPSGIALAAILLGGYRFWPGVWLGAFWATLWAFPPHGGITHVTVSLLATAVVAAGASVQAVFGAWLVRRLTGTNNPFTRVLDTVKFILFIAVGCSLISPTLGGVVTHLSGFLPWSTFAKTWFTWWLGDLTGVLVMAPLLLAWWHAPPLALTPRRSLEVAAFLLLLFVALEITFRHTLFGYQHLSVAFILLPLLIWSVLRFHLRGTMLALLLATGYGLLRTLQGDGPFVLPTVPASLVLFQAFIGVTTMTVLVLEAAMEERARNQQTIRELNQQLEQRVIERTQQLQILAATSQEMNTQLEIPVILRKLVAAGITLVHASAGAAGLVQQDEIVFSEYQRGGETTPIDIRLTKSHGVPGWVVCHRTPYIANDAAHDPQVVPELQRALGFFNLIDVPIISLSGELLGCLEIHNKAARAPFDDTDSHLLEGLVAAAAVALDNARLLHEVHAHERELRGMNRTLNVLTSVNEVLVRSEDESQLLHAVCEILTRKGGYHQAWAGYVEEGETSVIQVACATGTGADWLEGFRFTCPGQDSVCHSSLMAMQSGTPVIVHGNPDDLSLASWHQQPTPQDTASAIVLPLIAGDKRYGVLTILTTSPEILTPEEIHLLEELASDVAYGIHALRAHCEQQRAEEEVLSQRAFLTRIIDINPSLIFVKDWEGRYLLVNKAKADFHGLPREEIIGKTDNDLNPSIADQYRQDDLEVMRSMQGKFIPEEPGMSYKTGQKVWFMTYKVPFMTPSGQRQVLGISVDITDRKRMEERLREDEERYRLMVEGSEEVFFFEHDRQYRFTYLSPSVADVLGYTPQELLGQPYQMLLYGASSDAHVKEMTDRALDTGQRMVPYEADVRDKHGRHCVLEIVETPVMQDGQVVGIRGFARDITEQKHAEALVERERAFLSAGIDILPFPILFRTPSYEVLQANKAAFIFYDDTDTRNWAQMRLLSPDTRAELPMEQWPMARALRGEIISSFEAIVAFPDGREVPVLIQAAPIYVEGQLVASVVAFQDISALKAADQAKTQFLMVLSHELKTPLTAILGWAQAAQSLPDAVPEALERIVHNSLAQKRLLADLIDVSRIIHGKLQVSLEPVDLWNLAQSPLEEMAPVAQERHITLVTEPPKVPLPVSADPARIRQVILNLLENALKFTNDGGTVTLAAWREEDTAALAVRDTGRGIPPDQLHTLFTPFRQIERTEETGGLGLGLALVKGIMLAHGGEIIAESAGPGRGSVFTIKLPMRG